MAFLGSIFGGGANNASFTAGSTPIQSATVVNPIYNSTYGGLQSQTQSGLDQQQALVNALGAQNGVGNQSSVYAQQQGLANQLGAMAQGAGPNPALAQLNQTTGQNIQQQAALMAGQRGAGSNVGLEARQAAQQGAAVQQNAVGQAATLRANQQLAAISALQNQQSQLANTAGAQVGEQASALGTLNNQTQSAQNNYLAGITAQNQAQLANTQQYNQAAVSQQNSMNSANSSIAGINAQNEAATSRGLLNGVSSAIGLAEGGSVPKMSAGGFFDNEPSSQQSPGLFGGNTKAPSSSGGALGDRSPLLGALAGLFVAQGGTIPNKKEMYASGGVAANSQNAKPLMKERYDGKGPKSRIGRSLKSGKSPQLMTSQGLAQGGMALDMKVGGHVPGKAVVGGAKDSYSNDIVDAKLSPGEIVLPRSVTKSADPVRASAEFVAREIAKRSKRK